MTHQFGDPENPIGDSNPTSEPSAGYLDPALDTQSYLPLPATVGDRGHRRWRAGRVIGVGIAAAAALTAGAGVYAFQTLASSGIQPEHVLPSTVVAFAKFDFDPAASQKVAVYRLAQRLPALKSEFTSQNNIQDAILGSGFKAGPKSWSYAKDVKPWLGSRVAVAEATDTSSDNGLDPIVAIAYTNRAKMVAALTKAKREGVALGYVTRNGYVLISDTQAHANKLGAQAAAATLDANRTFSSDVKTLPGNQIAEGWVDYGAITKAVSHSSSSGGVSAVVPFATAGSAGRFVAGVHASASYLEMSGYEFGQRSPVNSMASGAITKLPVNTTGALEIGGIGAIFDRAWAALPTDAKQEYLSLATQFGVNLPADFDALFGSDLTVAVRGVGAPSVAVTDRTTAPARAKTLIDSLLSQIGASARPIQVSTTAHGYVVGNDAAFNAQVAAASGQLGLSSTFRTALPNLARASVVGYVNIASILAADPAITAKQRHDWGRLSAFGVTVNQTAFGSSFTARLTTR